MLIALILELQFCTQDLFIKALKEYVENVEAVYSDPLFFNLNNVNVKSMCDLLSKLYKYSQSNDKIIW